MENIIVTENAYNLNNILYLQNTLSELFGHTGCSVRQTEYGGRAGLIIDCPEEYREIVGSELADRAAEIIAVHYKYDFFRQTLAVSGLCAVENEILFASLIAADLDDDKKYAFRRFEGLSQIAIDGVYNFRLQQLKNKWKDIAEYMPRVFINTQLKDFISYMLEGRKKRVYVDDGKVYDAHYRILKRCALLGGEGAQITREVLLSGGGEVELSGRLEKDDEYYLKEYYGDKIYFSAGKLS